MGASDLIGRLAIAGVRLARIGEDRIAAEPKDALTDEFRTLIRQHKPSAGALEPVDRGLELRRQRVLAKLKASQAYSERPSSTRTSTEIASYAP